MRLVVCPAVDIGMFNHAVMGGDSFAQQRVSVSFLLLASDVLYSRACGGGIQIRTTQDNPPDRGSNSVYIC